MKPAKIPLFTSILDLVESTIPSRTPKINQPSQLLDNNDTDATNMDLAGREKTTIIEALEKTRWNKTAAAKLLGLSLRQLRYRLEKLDIE